MDSCNYTIAIVPKHCSDIRRWNELVWRQKEFRLKSLQLNPEAFGSTYEREQHFPWETWENRLRNHKATTFVALASCATDAHLAETNEDKAVTEILDHEWLGQVVLVEIKEEDEGQLIAMGHPWSSIAQKEPDEKQTPRAGSVPRFHLNACFVLPKARKKGIGENLVKYAISTSKGVGSARYTVIVNRDNGLATSVYHKCGFQIVSEYEYEQTRVDEYGNKNVVKSVAHFLEYFPKD